MKCFLRPLQFTMIIEHTNTDKKQNRDFVRYFEIFQKRSEYFLRHLTCYNLTTYTKLNHSKNIERNIENARDFIQSSFAPKFIFIQILHSLLRKKNYKMIVQKNGTEN